MSTREYNVLTSMTATPPEQDSLAGRQRWFSLAEFLFGGAIVIAHNVYRIIPNEVPILFVLGWISIRLRDGGWKRVGLRRPDSWWKTVFWAVLTGILVIVAGQFAEIAGAKIWGHPAVGPAVIREAKNTWKAALFALGVIWTLAAFGEEMSYRGYLLTRAADAGNRTKLAYLGALLASSVLFGYGHYYKGAPGILQSTVSGLILGGAYLLSSHNLWVPIFAHGVADTIVVLALFFGLAD